MVVISPSEATAADGERLDGVIGVSMRWIAAVLIGAVVLVNAANLVAVALRPWNGNRLSGTAEWLLLTSENNISTWLSTSIWFGAALAAMAISMLVDLDVRSRWRELSVVVLMLSVDEAASLHEKLTEWLSIEDGTVVGYAWVIPATVIVGLIALRLGPFVLRLDRPTQLTVVGGFGLLLLGAMGVETIAGRWDDAHGADNVTYHLISAVEENLEFAGAIVLLLGLLAAIRRHATRITVTLD